MFSQDTLRINARTFHFFVHVLCSFPILYLEGTFLFCLPGKLLLVLEDLAQKSPPLWSIPWPSHVEQCLPPDSPRFIWLE